MDFAALTLWAVFIFGLSTDHFSSAHTAPFTTRFVLRFIPGLAVLGLETIELLIRKAAHFSVYFVFAMLLTRVLDRRSGLSTKGQITWGIMLGGLYAISDELHQAFVPSRSPSAMDVLIDLIGLVFGLYCSYMYVAIRQAKTSARTHAI